jgi:hypothetical protein
MDEKDLKELILKKQVNGTIACKVALHIAEEAGASTQKIGRLLNEMKIKIHSCQLGCFP